MDKQLINIAHVLYFTKLLNKFQEVERVVNLPNREGKENDVEHSYQLAMLAWYIAECNFLDLDKNLIIKYALVHDFVEVYAGDTPTARIQSDADQTSKEEREAEALARIRAEFDAELPWIGETIDAYERRDTPEARFVKVVDKALPKITNALNKGATFLKQGHDATSASEFLKHQQEKVAKGYGSDQASAMGLLEVLGEEMMREIFE